MFCRLELLGLLQTCHQTQQSGSHRLTICVTENIRSGLQRDGSCKEGTGRVVPAVVQMRLGTVACSLPSKDGSFYLNISKVVIHKIKITMVSYFFLANPDDSGTWS